MEGLALSDSTESAVDSPASLEALERLKEKAALPLVFEAKLLLFLLSIIRTIIIMVIVTTGIKTQ